MAQKVSEVEANGTTVKATPNGVWVKGQETVKFLTRSELRRNATVDRV